MDNIQQAATRVGTGIDYITVTAASATSVRALLSFGEDVIDQEEGAGGVRKPFYMRGYQGFRAGAAEVGFSGTGALVRLSGPTANECAALALDCADNCSRLDVQVTVCADALGADHHLRVYASLATNGGGRGRPVARSLIQQNDGGGGVYLGKRISENYGRIYNKSVRENTRENPPHWRYEIEYKGRTAKKAAWSYAAADQKDSWCLSEVFDWFDKRHCAPPFSKVDRVGMRGNARGSDAQSKRIQWLRQCIKPVLERLAREHGWPDVLALVGVPMAYTDRYVNEVLGQED